MKFRFQLAALFLLLQGMVFSQGTTCQESEPFCTGTIYTFPAGTTGQAQPGANYGCLASQPAPAWYHMLIDGPGPITIYMYSTPLVDIDFCCWGPYSDPYEPCVAGLTANKIVSCSYSPNPTEYCNIPNGQTGEYYILLITNYSQQPCNITFSQTAGTGSTDCTILPPPVSNNGPLCVGETLELYASFVVNATYYWSGPGGFLSTQQNPVISNVGLVNGGTYSCVITVNGNSSDPATTDVLIYNKPSAGLLSEDTTVCTGTAAYAIFQFTGWPPYSVTYSDGTNTYTATGLSGPMDTVFLTPSAGPTDYSFNEVEDLHCSKVLISTNLTVDLYPETTAQMSGTTSICAGESAQLSIYLGGTPPWTITYTENGSNPQTVTANTSPYTLNVYPATTTTYEIQSVTDINCFGEFSGSAVVTVEPTPVTNAGTDQTISYGAYATLSGSASGGSGNYSYHWEPAAKLLDPNVAAPQTVLLSETTVFTMTTTDNASGCSDDDDVIVTIEGGPLGCFPTAAPNIICFGESSQLNSVASGGSGDYTYTWTSNPSGFSSDLPSPVVSPAQTTTYTVYVDDGFGTVSGTVTVMVNELPVPNAGTDITIANGTNTVLHGSATGGSTSYAYHWEPADKLNDPDIAEPQTENLFVTTLFTLTVTDISTGCVGDEPDYMSVIVSGDALSVSPIAAPSEICFGESTQLYSYASGGSGDWDITWSSDFGFSSNDPDPIFTPTGPGSYILNCKVDDGYNTATASVGINVLPRPFLELGSADTTVCVYDTLILDAGNPGSTYQWSNGSIEQTIKAGTTGIGYDEKHFSVVVTNQSGCQAQDEITVIFDFAACTGVDEPETTSMITLYPNPGSGVVHLNTALHFNQARVSVISIMGQKLQETLVHSDGKDNQDILLNLKNLPRGIYYIRFDADNFRPVILKYVLTD